MTDTSDNADLGELITKLEATGHWWMIGKGRAKPKEPLYGCVIQEAEIDGEHLASDEGHSLAEAIERALQELGE